MSSDSRNMPSVVKPTKMGGKDRRVLPRFVSKEPHPNNVILRFDSSKHFFQVCIENMGAFKLSDFEGDLITRILTVILTEVC